MANPPTQQALLELFERIVPPDFSGPLKEHESFALIRALAEIFAKLAEKGARSQQGGYFLAHALQTDPPASSGIRATSTVVLSRNGDLNPGLVAEPGELRLSGRGGRFYTNAERIEWLPQNPAGETQTAVFQSEIEGYAGNLDHLADTSGQIPLDRIEVASQSQNRAHIGGSIVVAGAGTALQDTGQPDLFDPADVGLYIRINQATVGSNLNRLLKITGFDFPEEELPLGSGLFPRRVFLDANALAQPREVYVEDASGPTFLDETADAIGAAGDVPVWPAVPAVSDAIYFASTADISGVTVDVTTAGVGAYVAVWEFFNGVAFVSIPNVDDPSDSLRNPGSHTLTWDTGLAFATRTSDISASSWNFVRLRLTTATVTTVPVLATAQVREFRPLVTESGSITWELEDFADLGVSIVSATAPSGGRDNDLRLLGEGRGLFQQDGESDDTFRARAARLLDVVSPNAILRAINRALRPFGFEGRAIDVANGLTGTFLGEDFFDYFTAGDSSVSHFTARLVSTANVAALTGTPVIDGVATAVGNVVLLVGQTTATENGAYIVAAGAWARDTAWGFGPGVTALNGITAVTEGTSFTDTTWAVNMGNTIGVDALTIAQLIADTFPTDTFRLLLSIDEAFGFFLVQVPFLTLGEYGFAYDEGPITLLGDGTFLGGALDSGFYDGTVVTADGIYASIHSTIDAIRAAGVGFAIVRSTDANDLSAC